MCYDGESPSVFEQRMIRARKRHVCCECGEMIEPGSEYQIAKGLWDGEWSTYHTCSRCGTARALAAEIERTGGCHGAEATPPFHSLADVLGERDTETAEALFVWSRLMPGVPLKRGQVIDAFVRVAPKLLARAKADAAARRAPRGAEVCW